VSYRLRVFLLVALVAISAIGATAWLTLSLANRQLTRSQDIARKYRADVEQLVGAYGRTHATWTGVAALVSRLSKEHGLRIRLLTIENEVLVDTDHLANRAARPTSTIPSLVDPRPELDESILLQPAVAAFPGLPLRNLWRPLSGDQPPAGMAAAVIAQQSEHATVAAASKAAAQLATYRDAVAVIRCIDEKHVDADVKDVQLEPLLPDMPYLTPAQTTANPECVREAAVVSAEEKAEGTQDLVALKNCTNTAGRAECLLATFRERVSDQAASPVQVYLGAVDDSLDLVGGPAFVGAAGLALLAIIGTSLVARQVSRPVRRLTAASRLLADGQLDARVPDGGHGDMATLSQSFNRMAEAVQRSEERQRRLVADVAHELRTPLSNLRGYLEGLQDGVVEPSRELFASLHEETLLQRRILDDLQVLALAEAGALGYTRGPVDLAELAEVGGTAHRAVAGEAGVRLMVDAPAPVWVDADPDRLRQVLGNLLTNAIRYTDAGGQVLVRAFATDGGATLTVTDTGAGIAPADLPQVFDRFWRADPARQRTTGGTGLGLTIAQRIVHDHGGVIEVASRVGVGATFTVRLPPAAAPAPDRPASPAA
jgi:two-component system sensor histidine kinase BaeS